MDRAQFDSVADEYRALHSRNIAITGESPEYFAEYKVKDMALALGPQAAAALRILDFGTGVGNALPYFRRYFPRASVIGADVSRRSLEVARERFPGLAALVVFDGDRLPFADASFDYAFTANVFHHIDHAEHQKHFSDLRRVIKPAGALFLFEHNPYNPLTLHAVNTCEFDRDAHLIRPGEMRRRLAAAGFAPVAIRFRIFFPHALRALRALEPWLVSVPLGAQYCALAHCRAR
jgi:SAM-dependent methyltransferase